MQNDEIVLSAEKYQELELELSRLVSEERKAIAERIKEARAMGDLSENFDYHDAKRQQGLLEGKIIGIRATLDRAKISDYSGGGDTVALGSVVKIHDDEFDEDLEYKIVGVHGSRPRQQSHFQYIPGGQGIARQKSRRPRGGPDTGRQVRVPSD